MKYIWPNTMLYIQGDGPNNKQQEKPHKRVMSHTLCQQKPGRASLGRAEVVWSILVYESFLIRRDFQSSNRGGKYLLGYPIGC